MNGRRLCLKQGAALAPGSLVSGLAPAQGRPHGRPKALAPQPKAKVLE